jgi:hypothetical protein
MAAVWTVYTVTNTAPAPEHTNAPSDDSDHNRRAHDGLVIRFELFEGPSGSFGSR